MKPVQAVKSGFRQYAVFSGRASRSEFWWFALFTGGVVGLFQVIIGLLLTTIIQAVLIMPFIAVGVRRLHDRGWSAWWIAPVACYNIIMMFAPWFVVVATGYYEGMAGDERLSSAYVYGFIYNAFPAVTVLVFYGFFIALLWCRSGTKGDNRFGPDPLHSSDDAA